jgi:2-polyprenyl-6-methoxyphenol hydroxylase-like FAD-dependent oxidoreductase
MMGLLPVGEGQLTMYWSLPAAALAPDVPLDLDVLQRAGRALWPEAADIVSAAVEANDFSRATYRNVALPRWNDGPILFIGDAAHGTSPQLGQGANLALVDGWTLADVLGECPDVRSATARFVERRGPAVRFYRQASHLLTPLFQSNVESFGWMRDAFMGIACRLPVARTVAASTLAGVRTGWLTSTRLSSEGRYRLDR